MTTPSTNSYCATCGYWAAPPAVRYGFRYPCVAPYRPPADAPPAYRMGETRAGDGRHCAWYARVGRVLMGSGEGPLHA